MRFQRENGADECPSVTVDHSRSLQNLGDIGHSGARGNDDDLVFLKRAGSFELLFAIIVSGAGADHCDEQNGDDGVADHHEWVTRARRSPWRRRNLLRLQRCPGTAWRNGRPLTHGCNLILPVQSKPDKSFCPADSTRPHFLKSSPNEAKRWTCVVTS